VPTLRGYLKAGDLPYFKLAGTILVKREHFDSWMQQFLVSKRQDLSNMVDDILSDIKTSKSN
jgi:hypothetical protein